MRWRRKSKVGEGKPPPSRRIQWRACNCAMVQPRSGSFMSGMGSHGRGLISGRGSHTSSPTRMRVPFGTISPRWQRRRKLDGPQCAERWVPGTCTT